MIIFSGVDAVQHWSLPGQSRLERSTVSSDANMPQECYEEAVARIGNGKVGL